MSWLRRRHDESIDSYLVRSILLLGSLGGNKSSSSSGVVGATVAGKSCVDEAVQQAVDSIRCGMSHRCPCGAANCSQNSHNNQPGRSAIQGGTDRQYSVTLQHWLRSATPGRSRFASSIGSRYSGNRSTYSYSYGSTRGAQSTVSAGRSSNATQQLADSRVDMSRPRMQPPPPPLYRRECVPAGADRSEHSYLSNRTDRERFSARSSPAAARGNFNMHSNQTDDADAPTVEVSTTAEQPSGDSHEQEANTNNSGQEQRANGDSKHDSTATSHSDRCSFSRARTTSSEARKQSFSTGAAEPCSNNTSNNNIYGDNNDTNNYYNCGTTRRAIGRNRWLVSGGGQPIGRSTHWCENHDRFSTRRPSYDMASATHRAEAGTVPCAFTPKECMFLFSYLSVCIGNVGYMTRLKKAKKIKWAMSSRNTQHDVLQK